MLLIYGSTGYTGRLIVAEAIARGLRPVLAARTGDAVRAQAESLGLEWRVARIDDATALDAADGQHAVPVHQCIGLRCCRCDLEHNRCWRWSLQ